MSASIKTLADGFDNEVYPKTKTAAVYDDNDNLLDTILSAKQNSTDSNLNTTAKTVVGAINEVDSDLGSPSSASAVTGNDAFSKISTLNSELTANKTISTQRVNIASYTAANKYTAPYDGYAYFQGNTTESVLNINNIGMSSGTTNDGRQCVYVKAGMFIHFEGSAPSWAYYQPITS